MPRAKVVCTLGPASNSIDEIRALIDAGMDVARLNASHGSVADRRGVLERLQSASAYGDTPVGTMLDVSGPEVRTAGLETPVEIPSGSRRDLLPGEEVDQDEIGLTHDIGIVSPGDTVLLDDGRIEMTVEAVDDGRVTVEVVSGGTLGGRKGVNVPGVDLGLTFVTEADRADLALAADVGVDFVAASFVGSAADIYAIEAVLEAHDATIPIIAKIERADAVENLAEIIAAADGVMVARGDLGVECPLEEVPLIQKRIIRDAREAGIPVITATEMLDSMVVNRRPTRAEASDVANAILDGTDAVMLSAETAVGDHPPRVVETMARIIDDVEQSEEYAETRERRVPAAGETRTDAIARSARYLARDVGASTIVTVTESGYTARKVSKYRPGVPVVAVTPSASVQQQLTLPWGITPRRLAYEQEGAGALIERAATAAVDAGVAESGDTVVVLAGMMSDLKGAGTTNTLKVHVAAEILAKGRGVVPGRGAGELVHTRDGELRDPPARAIIALPEPFEAELRGDLEAIRGIVTPERGSTSYAAVVARELGVPVVGGVSVGVAPDTVVTVDGNRGVVYRSDVDRNRDRLDPV